MKLDQHICLVGKRDDVPDCAERMRGEAERLSRAREEEVVNVEGFLHQSVSASGYAQMDVR